MTQQALRTEADLTRVLMEPLLHALSDVEREQLRRCATVRTFDRPLFEAELAHGASSAPDSFAQIASHSFVEALPGHVERYRILSSVRTALFHSWWPDGTPTHEIPEPLRALSERL